MENCFNQYQREISDIISIQNLLSNLNEASLESTIESIKSSKFIQNPVNLKIIIKIIGRIIKYRRKQIKCFFALIDEIFPTISTSFTKKEIMVLFSQKIIFLKLLHDKFITIEDIIEFYGIKCDKIVYFYPEIKDKLSYDSIFKKYDQYKCIIDYFSDCEGQTIDFNEDPRLQAGNINKLCIFIQNDDIDSFQQMISQNNINIRQHKITLTNFEWNKCLNEEVIYLIEYAAYHNSMKIFKFLLMNEAAFSPKLFLYAVCGGNNEIIHLAENALENVDFYSDINSILTLSIIFHRNDISDYLIEKFDIRNFFNQMSTSIYYENYGFFFKHILEINDDYNELLAKEDAKCNEISELIIFCAGSVSTIPLRIVVNFNDLNLNESLKLQIKRKTMENDKVTNPLVYAIQMFNNDNAKLLLSMDSVDPDLKLFYNVTPFIWACYVGNLEMVDFLYNDKKVNASVIIEESNENALHISVRMNNLEVVKFLVSLNIFDLAQKNSQSEDALQTAARLGYKEIFYFLKEEMSKNGIEIDENLKINDERFYPTHCRNPLTMANDFFGNLKERISVCILI